ncbi:MAG: hypothetical protein JXR25_03530 [Pontiellaceae bacterium]|nr:hypothetical protein [Pontiellaceae bacterium]MBN2783873.1 hypothetical protein [Pontiellaceae bacterium]
MKKIRSWIVTGCLAAAMTAQAGYITWSGLTASPLKDVALSEGWLLVLYEDVGKDNAGTWYNELKLDATGWVTSTSGSTINDAILNTFVVPIGEAFPGVFTFNASIQPDDNINIYSVLFNTSDFVLNPPSQFIVADTDPVNSGAGGSGSPVNYTINSFAGDWQAIPEPAVASLIGVAGIGFLFTRRLFGRM